MLSNLSHHIKENQMSEINIVKVIGFITNKVKQANGPIPDGFLSNEENMPKELKEVMRTNGWEDANQHYWWSEDFQPEPVMGEDGNVYLCLSDADMDSGRFLSRMLVATRMLFAKNT
jgi:hypothetical protein